MNRINIFIPSAGLGERLRPVTDYIPKPLIPFLGRPILDLILEKVSLLSINKIGINLHHKGKEIEDWISRSAYRRDIKIFQEENILGTGGALKNAEGFLKEGTFLVHNSDILSDIDLEPIINFHLSSGNICTLAVHDHPEFNNVTIDEKGLLKGVGAGCSDAIRRVAFTGIAVYSPIFLRFLPEGFSSIVDIWAKAIDSGQRIGTIDVTGCYWKDIGTLESYASALIYTLWKDGERIYIHPTSKVREDIWLDGYVVIEEGSIVDKGVSLRNTIILPRTEIKKNSNYESCMIGPEYKIGLDLSRASDVLLVSAGGSDKRYYRVKSDKGSAIFMESQMGDPDFERHIEYTGFFQRHSIPVPKLIKVNHEAKNALFEDLGDLSLYSWLKCPRKGEEVERIYRCLIDILVSLHTTVTRYVSESPLLKYRVFDYPYLRWETNYFVKRFVEGIRDIRVKNIILLEEEFHRLALQVDSFPKTVIHRDFQSQNIMIEKGGIPRLVDYQGSRIGPSAYDLVSILWDPYYRLGDSLRERLIDYYIYGRKMILESEFSERDFAETILPCRLQRHMQALGAFGFLSVVKGKKYFLKYVPEGLRLLKEDLSLSKNEYPELYKLVMGL